MRKLIIILGIILTTINVNGQTDPLEKLFLDSIFTPALVQLEKGDFDSCLSILSEFDSTNTNYYSITLLKSQLNWELRDYVELKKDLEYLLGHTETTDPNYSNLSNLYSISLKKSP